MASFARGAASLTRVGLSSSKTPIQLIQRRGLAGAADHHGPPKVNFWKDPMSPSKWKEEHFVIISLAGWGLLVYGGYKLFTGGKGKKEENLVKEASQ
ncbi:uncharacterized protein LOC106755728 [Vigna radiata var. radiata]|uniref:Uncharacterized protein LOC106755728 n=1 Tax=Vigna radiata var. radiata TaxID=3916 RepID=A0A1S3TI24_VIGRR|nr:uncharacterized protein LOC106755728 [Vigna radiata var. radiata]